MYAMGYAVGPNCINPLDAQLIIQFYILAREEGEAP